MSAVVDAVGQPDPAGDKQLVARHKRTAHLPRSSLGLVERREHRKPSDSKTSYPPSDRDLIPVLSTGYLYYHTHNEDEIPGDDADSAAKNVGDRRAAQRADQGTD